MKKILSIVAILLMMSAPSVMAGPLAGLTCNGNFDGDEDVDAIDVAEFLVHFGRSQYIDPCPSSPCPLTCEGTLSAGGRWCDQGDGTVKDMTNGLVWLKKADWGGTYPFWVNTMAGTNANDRASQLWDGSPYEGTAGLSDGSVVGTWRLPTRQDLLTIFNGTEAVSLDDMRFFTGPPCEVDDWCSYWSSTSYHDQLDPLAYRVYIEDGTSMSQMKDQANWVWPVRQQ